MLIRNNIIKCPITGIKRKEVLLGKYKDYLIKEEYNLHNKTGKPLNSTIKVYNDKTHDKIHERYCEYDINGKRVFKVNA